MLLFLQRIATSLLLSLIHSVLSTIFLFGSETIIISAFILSAFAKARSCAALALPRLICKILIFILKVTSRTSPSYRVYRLQPFPSLDFYKSLEMRTFYMISPMSLYLTLRAKWIVFTVFRLMSFLPAFYAVIPSVYLCCTLVGSMSML